MQNLSNLIVKYKNQYNQKNNDFDKSVSLIIYNIYLSIALTNKQLKPNYHYVIISLGKVIRWAI